MVRVQYAATITPPAPTLTTISGATTSASAGTKSIWLYCRCRAGITLFSPRAEIAIASGQGLQITLGASIRKPISDIREIGIVMSTDTLESNGCVVATYPGDGALPANITLTQDSHFQLRAIANNPDALPTSNLIHGMRRLVNSTNQIVEWKVDRWVPVIPQTFNPYIVNMSQAGGCNIDLANITDTSEILFPEYESNGSLSEGIIFWLVNDTNFSIPQGKRIRLSAATDPEDAGADDFKGLLQLKFLGYGNVETGNLDVSGMVVGQEMTYQGDQVTNLALPKDLLPFNAYMLEVRAKFDIFDVPGNALQGTILKIFPRFAANFSEYDPTFDFLGNYILPHTGYRRILPNGPGLELIADRGSGSVAYYRFRNLGVQYVPGLLENADEQKVIITNNGTCFVANSVPPETAALRAIVSTVDGLGQLSEWSDPISLDANTRLEVTVSHPQTIRADYPDVIAGTVCGVNASGIRIFVQNLSTQQISFFDAPLLLDPTEEIIVGGLAASGTIPALPVVADDFGLFTPTGFTVATNADNSVFTTASYRVAIAYIYTGTVTKISHDTARECLYELDTTLVTVFTSAKYNGAPTADVEAMRNLLPASVYNWQLRYSISENFSYRFNPYSTKNDDGVNVIKLHATPVNTPGRFIRQNSSKWYDSASYPTLSADLGDVGDYYVNVDSTSVLAGQVWRKTANGWDDIGSIRGADGKAVLNGIDAPTSQIGGEGDFYLDTSNYNLYGPKTSGNWGSPTSLIGPAGPQGEPGPIGSPGVLNSQIAGLLIDSIPSPPAVDPDKLLLWNNDGAPSYTTATETRELGDRSVAVKMLLISLLS